MKTAPAAIKYAAVPAVWRGRHLWALGAVKKHQVTKPRGPRAARYCVLRFLACMIAQLVCGTGPGEQNTTGDRRPRGMRHCGIAAARTRQLKPN
jgi:hypothetical protein